MEQQQNNEGTVVVKIAEVTDKVLDTLKNMMDNYVATKGYSSARDEILVLEDFMNKIYLVPIDPTKQTIKFEVVEIAERQEVFDLSVPEEEVTYSPEAVND